MAIGKIIAFDTLKNRSLDPAKEIKQPENNTVINGSNQQNAEIIPLQFLQTKSMLFNLELDSKKLMEFCIENDIKATPNQIRQSILNYYISARKLKDIPKRALEIAKSFEKDFNSVDFGSLTNIRNFFRDGLIDEKKVLKHELLEDYDYFNTDYEKSKETMSPLVQAYAKCIMEQLPEYRVAISKTKNQEGKKVCEYIDINKGNYTISFSPQDFLYSMLNKKLTGDFIITFPAEDGFEYSYTSESSFIQKNDTKTDLIEESICDYYNSQGNPIFYIDPTGLSGPVFYLSKLLDSNLHSLRSNEMTIKFIENTDESTLNTLARFLENDKEASELLKNGFPLEMILNCVRNGVFNMNVAEAITYILEQTKDWTFELLNPEYLNNIINLIDTEDHYFEEDMLDLVRFLIQKEHDSLEDKHEKIYEILSFAQSNYNEKNIKILQKMAAFKFISFDEIEKLLDVLLHFIENDNKKAMEKIDKIAQEYKEKYDGSEKAKRIFLSFFEPYLKNNFK